MMDVYKHYCDCCGKPWRHDCVIGPGCQCDLFSRCGRCHKCARHCKCEKGFATTDQVVIEKLTKINEELRAEIARLTDLLERQRIAFADERRTWEQAHPVSVPPSMED